MHTAVFNGSGHHCSTCGCAWDADEMPPEACIPVERKPFNGVHGGRIYAGGRALPHRDHTLHTRIT